MIGSLVVTVIGRDKPGLVNALSEKVAAFGGSWLESRMARLAGEFAGIVLVEVPERNVDSLTAALRDLETTGLRTTVERSEDSPPRGSYKALKLDLIAQDRPGIVRDITQALAQKGVNIEEFASGIASASFSGEHLFKATARLRVLDKLGIDDLRRTLERLANEMMVDITLDDRGERVI